MRGVRIRPAGAAKLAAITVAALAGLQTLPGLLKPPQPPPLAADVGLPRQVESRVEREPQPKRRRVVQQHDKKQRPHGKQAIAPAIVVARSAAPPTAPAPTPAPEPPARPPAPAPISAPPAPPAPAPGDGSEEFAPH